MSWVLTDSDIVKKECPELNGKTKIVISEKAEVQIMTLLEAYPNLEWNVGLLGKKNDGEYHVDELKMVEQEVTGTEVQCTREGNKELAKIKNLIGWLHSHNDMESFMSENSGGDFDTAEMYPVSICVNNAGHFTALVKKKLPCGREALTWGKVFLARRIGQDKEILKAAKKLIKKKKPEKTYKYEHDQDYNYCATCGQKIGMGKISFCDRCGMPIHKNCAKIHKNLCVICAKYPDTAAAGRYLDAWA